MALLFAETDNENDIIWHFFFMGMIILATIFSMLGIGTCLNLPIYMSTIQKDMTFEGPDYCEWFASNQKSRHAKLLLNPNRITLGSMDEPKRQKRSSRAKLTKTIRRFYSAATR